MEEIFVTKLRINKVRHLENLEIPLSDTERKHLILTGKNGSGKTSVLEGIAKFLSNWLNSAYSIDEIEEAETNFIIKRDLLANQNKFLKLSREKGEFFPTASRDMITFPEYNLARRNIEVVAPCSTRFTDNNNFALRTISNSFLFKIFESKRSFSPKESKGPQKIELKNKYSINEYANENFVRQLVNLRLDLLDAKDVGKIYEADQIEEWFKSFINILKEIFEDDTLQLVFDRPNFNYNIITEKKEAFNLNQLSDGYSAFLTIVTELIMRMSGKEFIMRPYDAEGLVLIDEVENHLHISLQKKILPFLTSFFPKIQFIVTTHSPFVLSSIDNAVIYDLEKQQRIEDLSDYSYQELVETYFGTDQYSDYVKQKLNEYEVLIQKENHTEDDEDKLYKIRKYFRKLPFFLSPELQLKIQSLELYSQNSQV